jgi:hypothetical protein
MTDVMLLGIVPGLFQSRFVWRWIWCLEFWFHWLLCYAILGSMVLGIWVSKASVQVYALEMLVFMFLMLAIMCGLCSSVCVTSYYCQASNLVKKWSLVHDKFLMDMVKKILNGC